MRTMCKINRFNRKHYLKKWAASKHVVLSGINGMKAIINSVFEQIQQDSDLRRFYKDCDYGVVKNKYAYFIA